MRWPHAPAVIRGQRVVFADGVRPASVHLHDGRIARVSGFDDTGPPGQDVLDVEQRLLMPGLVDTHVHINEPGRAEWEGFATATSAAAAGGVTTLLDMPLNSVPATNNARALDRKRRSAEGKCRVDVGFLGGVVPGNAGEHRSLWDAGVFAFKCFLVPSGVDEFRNVSRHDLEQAMPGLAKLGATLMVHAELPDPIDAALPALAERDRRQYATYHASRPPLAETDAVRLVIALARQHAARAHIVHVSSAESIPLLREAVAAGVRITAETCPHYLAIVADEIPDGATQYKCAPPIRERANQDLLWSGLSDDTLSMIVTDHSPCPPAMKRPDTGDFFAAWGGIASLELSLAIVLTEARRRGVELASLARWMCAAPARLTGLSARKGSIAPGADADFAILNDLYPFVVDQAKLFQRHKLTPYHGRELAGRVAATYLGGHLIFADNALVGEPRGRLLSRAS